MTSTGPYITIQTHGAVLEMPSWLVLLWPKDYDLPLAKWPTFCGPGSGLLDWLVPDQLCGVKIAPACFIHDIEFAILERTWAKFMAANWRLYRNVRALVWAQVDRGKFNAATIERRCLLYLLGTMVGGWGCFQPTGSDWKDNPVVRQRLNRLARAAWGLEDWERDHA